MAKSLQTKALFKKLHIALIFALILISESALAQSLLLPGDLVFVSVNASNNSFEIVPLITLDKGTEFDISNGLWNQSDQHFTNNETLQLIANEKIPAGSIIQIKNYKNPLFQISGKLNLNDSGDLLFAYQREFEKNRFIYAIGWGKNVKSEDQSFLGSDIPQTLKNIPNTILTLGEAANHQYYIRNGASGTPDMIRSYVSQNNYWRSKDNSFSTLGTSFKILNAPVINFDYSLSHVSENEKEHTLNVSIFEHDGSKLTVDVVFDSVYSSVSRAEISNYKTQQINFTGIIGNSTKQIKLSLSDDDTYEGNETAIFALENVSNGTLGDFISHTLLIVDDEIPEIKIEVIENQEISFLLIHNLEREKVDLNKWTLSNGDKKYVFDGRVTLEVGETKFLTLAEAESILPKGAIVVDEESYSIFSSSGTLELKNADSKKIASFNIPKKQSGKSATSEVYTEKVVSKIPQSVEASQSQQSKLVLQKAVPGWKYIAQNSFIKEDYSEIDVYFWDEITSSFVKFESNQANDQNPILVGYFDANNAEILKKSVIDEKEKSLKTNALSITLSSTDANQNESIDGSEGFSLVANNSNQALLSTSISKQLHTLLKLNYEPQLFKSNIDFSDIRIIENEYILPNELFWVKLIDELPSQTIELDFADLSTDSDIVKKDENKREVSIQLKGKSGEETVNISFNTEDELVQNLINPSTLRGLYLNSPKDVMFSIKMMENSFSTYSVTEQAEYSILLPLQFGALVDGEFKLSVSNWTDIPEDWVLQIEDEKEQKLYELNEDWEITFDYFQKKIEDSNAEENPFPELNNRFTLKLVPKSLLLGEDGTVLPESVELYQNYPNPFNPATTISFFIPEEAEVKLSIFNIVGQPVAVLINELKSHGEHTLEWDASDLPSGMYIYQLEVGTKIMTRKMTLVK